MAKRDPNKTARNKAIKNMKQELRELLPSVLKEIDKEGELSLNAYIGHKTEFCIDLKNEVIKSPDEYVSKWLQGLTEIVKEGRRYSMIEIYHDLKNVNNINFRKYCEIFLRRSFLNHYDELSKVRPREDEASYWFGLNDAQHGIFVTPRYNIKKGEWENDKSEIRSFSNIYWSIGHILETGLCFQGEERRYLFNSIDDYFNFFYNQVRLTRSKYQLDLAKKYMDFVKKSSNPEKVPLLIPELRFNSEKRHHEHRLDFFIINPYTMEKIGFEISPWSTHGKLSGKNKTLKELNKDALDNFEKELKKMKAYYQKYNIHTIIFTDSDLLDIDEVFEEIKKYLSVSVPPTQLSMNLIEEYFGMK